MTASTTLGFLHTAHAHVATFEALASGRSVHQVDPRLLERARTELSPADRTELAADVLSALTLLVGEGAEALVCTCSTLGPIAEQVAAHLEVPVVRIDRPMARRAVGAGPRVGVVVVLASALAPTLALLEEEALAHGVDLEVQSQIVEGAWSLFEAGQTSAYVDTIVSAVRGWGEQLNGLDGDGCDNLDVIVLAQASMADAGPLLADLGVSVLTSPSSAVEAAERLIASAPTERCD